MEKRDVEPVVNEQIHYNTLMDKVNREFTKMCPLAFGNHLVRTHESISSKNSRKKRRKHKKLLH